MLDAFTADTFSEKLGQPFRSMSGDLALVEVSVLGAAGGGRAPFSLVFRGRPDAVLAQGIHGLDHADLGAFELFLVPIGPDGEGPRYEAVFT